MPSKLTKRIIARVRALVTDDWRGAAGKQFREALGSVTGTIEVSAKEAEYARAAEAFERSEQERTAAELKRRTLVADLRAHEAGARKAEMLNLQAELELWKKLQDLGVVLQIDENGNLTLVPAKPPQANS
jgi:hypothetical protein